MLSQCFSSVSVTLFPVARDHMQNANVEIFFIFLFKVKLEFLKGCQFHIHCSPILQDKIPYSRHTGFNHREAGRHKVNESQGVKMHSQTLLFIFFLCHLYLLLGMVNLSQSLLQVLVFLILCLHFFPLMYLRRKKERSKEEGQEGGRGKNQTNKKKFSTNTANPSLHRVNVFYPLG